jgi:YVTN family beta-propeller protein
MRKLLKVLVLVVFAALLAVPVSAVAGPRMWAAASASPFSPGLDDPVGRLAAGHGGHGSRAGRVPVELPQVTELDPVTRTLYVSTDSGTIHVIDASRCSAIHRRDCPKAEVATIAAAGDANFVVDQSTRTLYAAYAAKGTISVIDATACNARVTTGCAATPAVITTGGTPLGLALDPSTHTLYAGNDTGNVSVIDTTACNRAATSGCGQSPATIPLGPGAILPTLDRATGTLYVPQVGNDASGPGSKMAVVDARACNATATSGCTAVAEVSFGEFTSPLIAELDTPTHTVYVQEAGNMRVAIVDGATCNAREVSGCAATPPTFKAGPNPSNMVIDERTRTMYFTNEGSDTLSAVDIHACHAGDTSGCPKRSPTLATGLSPYWVTLDPSTGTLYVPEHVDADVAAFDARDCNAFRHQGCRHEAAAADVPDGTFSVAVDTDHHTLLVGGGGGLDLLDTRDCNAHRANPCATPESVPLGTELRDIAVDRRTHTAYLADANTDGVFVLDTSACHTGHAAGCVPVATVTSPGAPVALDVNPVTHTVYVANIADNSVTVIRGTHCRAGDTSGCGSTTTVGVGPSPFGIAVDRRTNSVYVGNFDQDTNQAQLLDGAACDAGAAGCTPLAAIPTGPLPLGLAIDQGTRTLYTANQAFNDAPGSLSVVDLRQCNAANTSGCAGPWPTTPAGRGVWAIAIDPRKHAVFTANFGDASASVIDGRRCNARDHRGCDRTGPRVPIGDIPLDVAIDPVHHLVFTSDAPELAVSVIDERAPCSAPVRCLR